MANISEKVEQIRKAIYGKDVRESIASGIEAINDHVETTVAAEETREANEAERIANYSAIITEYENFNEEVEQARESLAKEKEFETLGARLEESEQDLDNHETAADPHDQYALDTDLATLQTEVTSHKAETVSEIVVVTRDITIEGQQTVAGFSKLPKRIDVLVGLIDSYAASIGNVSKNAQGCLYISTDAKTGGWGGHAIYLLSAGGANRVAGQIVINQDRTITITWSKTGTPPTGTASVRLIAHYHGGE